MWMNKPLSTIAVLVILSGFLFFTVGVTLSYICWNFRLGRFQDGDNPKDGDFGYIVKTLLSLISSEFRHLLALIIVGVFAIVLFLALIMGYYKDGLTGIKEGLQVVTSTLGGLVGSIVGFYFGTARDSLRSGPPPVVNQTGAVDEPNPLPDERNRGTSNDNPPPPAGDN